MNKQQAIEHATKNMKRHDVLAKIWSGAIQALTEGIALPVEEFHCLHDITKKDQEKLTEFVELIKKEGWLDVNRVVDKAKDNEGKEGLKQPGEEAGQAGEGEFSFLGRTAEEIKKLNEALKEGLC